MKKKCQTSSGGTKARNIAEMTVNEMIMMLLKCNGLNKISFVDANTGKHYGVIGSECDDAGISTMKVFLVER